MAERIEVLEAALESLPEGIALLGAEGQVVFWNRAAEAIAGYAGAELLSQQAPEPLKPLLSPGTSPVGIEDKDEKEQSGRACLARFPHKLGHEVPVIARHYPLRDESGGRIGAAIVFHPTEGLDALPHGECSPGSSVETSRTEFEDRLGAVFEDFLQGGEAFGVLWIMVDQSHDLRQTHGAGACDAMLEKIERALVSGLRTAEEMGRWGDDEYMILSHERTPEMLAAHAQALVIQARSADFRWWGDRVMITVSIGAAHAVRGGNLIDLLEQAKASMISSRQAGGNRSTPAPGGYVCLPS